jgi:CRP-like cAMP-binding protein/phosphoribosyl 1,2-cyclic phosphodiesterase
LEPLKTLSGTVTELPRGGYLVDTPRGYVQFGAPPETIKDTMFLPLGVPQVFVLPKHFFNWKKGISVAELEFPIYYNFFLKKKKTVLICSREQYERFRRVFNEAVFGPKELNVTQDYSPGLKVPELKKEMSYFSSTFKFSDMVGFGILNEKNRFTYNGITITMEDSEDFSVFCEGNKIATVPGKIQYKATYLIGTRLTEPYNPPLFGMTCLGPSHGFDPHENTSGFIVWLNHCGIMIDPPVNSTEWLEDSNVNPKFIDSIILTHCHADHDAGTFQKILEEGKITIYTTRTVMSSFLEKYSAFADVSQEFLQKLFDFRPVKVGEPFFIHGGKFNIFYTLHSIPAIGFKLEFQDQTMVYSSDHNNDPSVHKKLLEAGVIDKSRYEELKHFPWDSRVIYHESGIAPLHTPIDYLDCLPDDIRRRSVIYHISEKDFPKETLLKLAKFGIENTHYFEVSAPPNVQASQILGVPRQLDFFHDMTLSAAQEFIDIVEVETFKKGDVILRKGTQGDKFYIIYMGCVSVASEGLQRKKIYGAYDYFGELALITNQTRSADVIAETDVTAFTIEKDKFLNFISGSDFERMLHRLARIRDVETWNVLSTSPSLEFLTSTQKTWLESMLIPTEFKNAGTIYAEGDIPDYFYIIRNGEVTVEQNGRRIATLTAGDFIVQMSQMHNNEPLEYTFHHNAPLSVYAISKDDALRFVEKNPGVIMKLVYDF